MTSNYKYVYNITIDPSKFSQNQYFTFRTLLVNYEDCVKAEMLQEYEIDNTGRSHTKDLSTNFSYTDITKKNKYKLERFYNS